MPWSIEDVHAFLMAEPRLGRLATATPEGIPHVVPIWFTLVGAEVHAHTAGESTKARNIRANPRFALAVDDPVPPYKGVTLMGEAEVVGEDVLDSRGLARDLAIRYMGLDEGAGFGEHLAAMPGEHVTLVLRPERWESWDFSA